MVKFDKLFEGFESSNLKRIRYSTESKTLEARFVNGTAYEYAGVQEEVYRQFLTAESVGKTFNALIKKGGYPYKKVE